MKKLFVLPLILSFLLGSCVPLSQYKKLQQDHNAQSVSLTSLNNDLRNLNITNTELTSRIRVLERQISRMDADVLNSKRDLNRMKEKYRKADELYQNLLKIQSELASGSDRETSRILRELQLTQQSLMEKEDNLTKLEASLEIKRKNLEKLEDDFETQNTRLAELESVLSQKDSIMNGLRAKVAQALYAFSADELSVEMKNGKVFVSLEEKLLFGSGSYKVGSKGVDAIKKLAGVLEQNPEILILIEGHTDNVSVNSSSDLMIDNWDLSVKRATSIVRILLDSSIDPRRLTAAGRSKYIPVETNETSEGKQKNRRTEIILTPRLDELFNLIGK
ncbi:MAG: OmpA family protein [Bacteroidetes bacterium]|jgi:chemotaxis protein MotB|nr:OmpA family protein [Bacteroidota bacterium]MBT3747901.1 OmpA family protein [Bacteroidota bacterium]MBT4410447.1 OmpA family protein [Bacteroidota bacterium]MBT5427068.1 OmpA family protein [Bacteroidota bacterium]MBT7095077.1 OmpA family protein [Bacteroidota bacterium]